MSAGMDVIEGRARDLGGFAVRRVLPSVRRRMVGPFIFLDEMGPAVFGPGQGIDVRPHPHIGLATLTYLFEGEILHRDSLGTVQPIRPGDVNWMTAGRGVSHSERTGPELRARGHRLHGMQAWVALPAAAEDAEPAFAHHPKASLPSWAEGGARLRLIAGSWFGRESPVATASPMIYADAALDAGATLSVPPGHAERAVYVATGAVKAGAETIGEGRMAACDDARPISLTALTPARVMILGGAPLPEPRLIWWNFVASSAARLDAARADWAQRRTERFGQVPGETEFIPLPEQ